MVFKFVCRLQALILLFVSLNIGLFASDTLSFEPIYDEEKQGLSCHVITESLIPKNSGTVNESYTFNIPQSISKCSLTYFLFITGEAYDDFSIDNIKLSVKAKTSGFYKITSNSIIYNKVYSIKPSDVINGKIELTNIPLVTANPGGKYKYTLRAVSLIAVTNSSSKNKNRLRIFSGISSPIPGNIYSFTFKRKSLNYKPSKISVAGAHGIKGNATGNILNGITLSGGDDWDSSEGTLWDFDEYDISSWKFHTIKEYIFQVDTILNWIYPEIIIFEEEVL